MTIPPDPAPLMRGPIAENEPPVSQSANYGAPGQRAPRPYPQQRAPYPPPFSPKHPLPALEPYKSSWAARKPPRPGKGAPPPVTVAATPRIKTKPRPKAELQPFDPLGVKLGSTLLFPYVQASGGFDDNPNRLPAGYNLRPSAFFRGGGGVKVKSDWSSHSLEGELSGAYSDYFNDPAANRPEATGQAVARYDVTKDTALDLRARLSLDTMRPGAPSISSGQQSVYVVNRPAILGMGGQAGPTQKFGRTELSLRAACDRVWYQNAQYSNGTTLDLARTSYNDYGALLRVSYEATPDLKPFVEATIDRRAHDFPTDENGFWRDSVGYIARGGAALNFTALVKGEVSGGYGRRDYVDPRLPPLRGPVIDAALIYTPSALTTVMLRGATSMNETTLAGASGALSRSVTATLSHDLLRNLNVSLTGNYFTNTYQGANVRERGGGVGVRLEYKITRSISLRGSYMRERLNSSYPNADYTANVYLVGLRLQP